MGLQDGGLPAQEPAAVQGLQTSGKLGRFVRIGKPGSISPENKAGITSVGGDRSKLVTTLEIGDFYVSTLW